MIEELDTRYGRMFVPSTDTGQYWWLKHTGASPEDEMIEMVCDLLDERPKGIAIDCGANFGCWTLALAPHATQVIAFEPQPGVASLLRRSIEASLFPNIHLFDIALGFEEGWAEVPVLDLDSDSNFGGVELNRNDWGADQIIQVDVRCLDDVVQDGPISFIKADVEGGELDLLKGAERLILKWKPIIICECDHPRTNTEALGKYIESLGYNVEIAQDNNFIGMPV